MLFGLTTTKLNKLYYKNCLETHKKNLVRKSIKRSVICGIHTVMVTSRQLTLQLVLVGCRGDLLDDISPAVLVNASLGVLDGVDDDRTIALPFLGADVTDNLPLLLLLLLLVVLPVVPVVVMRDADGDLADGDVSLSVGDSDEATTTAS